MALSRLTYNSLNVTPTASKGIGFDSGADDLAATFSGGAMTFIKKLTASASATLSFVDGASDVVLDSTYKEYVFTFKHIHPGTEDSTMLQFQGSIDSGSNYNVAMTTTSFRALHTEADTTSLAYSASTDLAQGTGFQYLEEGASMGNDNDQCLGGTLTLFNPSSTTFVKHFIGRTQFYEAASGSFEHYTAGYFNTTSAIDEIQFKMDSGNIDAGTISLYGIN